MTKIRLLYVFCASLFILMACSGGDEEVNTNEEPEIIVPTNLVLNINIIGADNNNPNGDGSGVIQCTATATNAVKFGFKFGSAAEIEDIDGEIEHTFDAKGTNNYVVSVFAYSRSGQSINSFKSIDVYVMDSSSNGYQLVWSDEFDVDGAPNSDKWTFNLGDGCPDLCGWGNGESQYYTDRSENVEVKDGVLKIKAKKEAYQSAQYTSARLLTKGKFGFTYGKMEVRAKLPGAQGTWPAIWLLGANIDTVGWPACGEIDVMEQKGDTKNSVLGTCHWLANGSNASYGLETSISNASTQFHLYSMEWTENHIKIFLDNVEFYEIVLNETLPFDKDFFIILNIAMGGTLGGTIDPGFTEDTMEIDYIRVYQ